MQPSFASFIATVVEAEIDELGEVKLRRVTCAVDTGIAVNPDTVVAQLEGGLIFGLTAALYGEVTIDKGRVQQSNFNDYRMLRIDQAPIIEVHVIKSGEAPGGIGETGVTAVLRRYATRSLPRPASPCGGCRLIVPCLRGRNHELRCTPNSAWCGRHRRGRPCCGSLDPAWPWPDGLLDGKKVTLADYKAADPTGVPASIAKASLVERGAYLARAADCVACHTPGGGKGICRRAGDQAAVRHAVFDLHHARPGNRHRQLQRSGFLDAVRRGVRRDGARLYPAMPYASYSYMTDADVLAIKAYLFSLPPVHAKAPENTLTFPYNQRRAMIFWSALFNPDTRFAPDSTGVRNGTGALISRKRSSIAANAIRRAIWRSRSTTGRNSGALTAGWRAFNISSDKATGIGGWRDEDLVAYLAIGHADGHGTASGPMGEAVDHSFSLLAPEDIRAVVAYLRTVPPIASPDLPATWAPPAPASHKQKAARLDPRGKMVFEGACVSCHGWTGENPISPFATLTGAWAVNDLDATNVAQVVISGTRRRVPDDAVSMPAFGNAYSDDEIAAVANYVTARFGSKGSRLTARDAELRKQTSQ